MILKEVVKNNHILRVIEDEDIDNPRDGENVGTMITFSRYRIGDKHDYSDYEEAIVDVRDDLNIAPEVDTFCPELVKKFYEEAFVLPLYVYDHSGISISTTPFSCKWDSCRVGFIYTTREDLKTFGLENKSRDEVLEILKGEVDVMNMYINGECFGYSILKEEKCECCGHIENNEVDSCWGFLGTNYKEQLREAISEDYQFLVDELED